MMDFLLFNVCAPVIVLIAVWAMFDRRAPSWARVYVVIHGAVFYLLMGVALNTLSLPFHTALIYSLTMGLAAGGLSWRVFTWLAGTSKEKSE